MATALFDIEADGLNPTKVHCLVLREAKFDSERESFRPHQMKDAVARLQEFDTCVAHNGLTYDVPVLVRLLGFKPRRVRDSLVLSRMLFGNIKEALDSRLYARTKSIKLEREEKIKARAAEVAQIIADSAEEGLDEEAINDRLPPPLPPDDFIGFPGNMQGRHGIEAWGMRFGMYKGDYAKQMTKKGLDPWAEFNEDMLAYCQGDVDILHHLWMTLIRPRLLGYVSPFSVEVEITETFNRLGVREFNKREFKIPLTLPGECFTSDKPFNIGALLQEELAKRPTSLPEKSNPAIAKIVVRDFPGYCSLFHKREIEDTSRGFVSIAIPSYIDRAEMQANEKKTAKEFDIDIASALLGQSKNRQVVFKPLNSSNVIGASPATMTEQFTKAVGALKLYGHGPTAGKAVEIEHYMASAMADLEDSGIYVDPVELDKLVADLTKTHSTLEKEIMQHFRPRLEPTKWVLRTFSSGPADANSRKQSAFPIARVLFPAQKAHIPQRNLPDGYKREYWGGVQADPVYTRAKKRAEARGEEFVDTRACILANDGENTMAVYDGDRTPVKMKALNPRSRQQLARRLMEEGWFPEAYTATGGPALDDTELKKLAERKNDPMPIAETIRVYLLVQKRLGQIANGKRAWKKMIGADGMVHPHINPCGAVTARATHSNPNISQVPTVVRVKDPTPEDPKRTRLAFGREGEWGADCRRLFTVPNTYRIAPETHPDLFFPNKHGELHVSAAAVAAFDPSYYMVVGADLAGIELRMLAHYLMPYDGGKFMHTLLNEDVHEANRVILQFANREDAKRFLFALLYGAGDEKLGSIYNPTGTVAEQKAAGRMFRERLMSGIVGFKDLVNALRADSREGTILALDGRLIPIRSPHAALNTLLQSGGALVSKYWIREAQRRAREELGLVYDKTWSRANGYAMLLWSHDELQKGTRAKYAIALAKTLEDAAAHTQTELNLSIAIKAEAKIGLNWLETH